MAQVFSGFLQRLKEKDSYMSKGVVEVSNPSRANDARGCESRVTLTRIAECRWQSECERRQHGSQLWRHSDPVEQRKRH